MTEPAIFGAAAQAAGVIVCLYAAGAACRTPRPAPAAVLAGAVCGAACSFLPSPWSAAGQVAAACLLLHIFQHLDWRRALLISVFVVAETHFWLFACSALVARQPQMQPWAALAPAAVLAVLAAAFARQNSAAAELAQRSAAWAALSGVLVLPLAWQLGPDAVADGAWAAWMILAVVLVGIVLVGRSRRRYTAAQQLADRRELERAEAERHYRETESLVRANATLYHDMRHHLTALGALLTAGKADDALEYIHKLQAAPAAGAAIWSGNAVLDGIIAAKTASLSGQIDIDIDCRLPETGIIAQADLASVVGNLLDNAVTAAQRSGVPQPFVELRIQPTGSMLVIRTRNSAAPDATITTHQVPSGDHHGWGLVSVRDTAERYDGAVDIWREGDVCCVAAAMRFEDPR